MCVVREGYSREDKQVNGYGVVNIQRSDTCCECKAKMDIPLIQN